MTLHGKVAFRGPVPQPMRRCGIFPRRLPSDGIVRPAPGGAEIGDLALQEIADGRADRHQKTQKHQIQQLQAKRRFDDVRNDEQFQPRQNIAPQFDPAFINGLPVGIQPIRSALR